MTSFIPNGFLPMSEAIMLVGQKHFEKELETLERLQQPQASPRPDDSSSQDPVRFALMHRRRPELDKALSDIVKRSVNVLRGLLHRAELTATYFDAWGQQDVPSAFWATADADGVIERGVYLSSLSGWVQLVLSADQLSRALNPGPVVKTVVPHRPPDKRNAVVSVLQDLYPDGDHGKVKSAALLAQINAELRAKGLSPVSAETLKRAAKQTAKAS